MDKDKLSERIIINNESDSNILTKPKDKIPSRRNSNYSEISKQNHLLGQKNLNILQSHSNKERMLMDLKSDLKYYEGIRDDKMNRLKLIIEKREISEKNKNKMAKYAEKLRQEMGDFVKGIDHFENNLYLLKEEKKTKLEDKQIMSEEHLKSKGKLEEEIKKVEEGIKQQEDTIEQLHQHFIELERIQTTSKKDLILKETRDIDKYNELFRTYRDNLNNFKVFESEESNSQIDELLDARRECQSSLQKEQLISKLNDLKYQYELLEGEYNELNEENQKEKNNFGQSHRRR
ncbi:MAG: hypothetical protein MJ252_16095, partial [archaeon]|nr:hypothetical protein [archaeon]